MWLRDERRTALPGGHLVRGRLYLFELNLLKPDDHAVACRAVKAVQDDLATDDEGRCAAHRWTGVDAGGE